MSSAKAERAPQVRQNIGGMAIGFGLLSQTVCKRCCSRVLRIPELGTVCFLATSAAFGSLKDEPTLLLGQGCVEVKHERIGVRAHFSHDERNALRHQARHKGYVAGKPM